ncbi:DNA polymerase I, thermostable [compost metagenome]
MRFIQTITMGETPYQVYWVDDMLEVWERLKNMAPEERPKWAAFDTESTGLHIKKDRAFLGAIAWTAKHAREVFVFESGKNWQALVEIARLVKWLYGHNTVYDMHMFANEVGNEYVYQINNWADTMGLLRATFDAVSPRDGGESLALKKVSKKYIDSDADRYEKAVKGWLKMKAAADRKILIAMLKQHKWTMKRFEEATNKGTEEVPQEVMDTYFEWLREYPAPTYQAVPMDIMFPYVASDVILTDMLVEKALPVVLHRNQWPVMLREFKNLKSTFRMTRRGFRIDRDYLFDCKVKLDTYIEEIQERMHSLAGREFSVGQHAVIKEIYAERLGKAPESTDKQFLKKQISQEDELALLIKKLRSLEKWRSTYVDHLLEASEYDGRLYPGLNQFGTVSGRHSGDFQQMPKDALLTLEGDEQKKANNRWDPEEELFHPRKAVITDDGSKLFSLDFSQEELRFQAHFTLPFGGDVNLCRAYMPFKCVHHETGEIYDHTDPNQRERWGELRPGAPEGYWEDLLKAGWSAWVVPETRGVWIPTDVHSSTARKALAEMGMDPDNIDPKLFKHWRNIGKTYNFMKIYGGGPKKSAEVLDITVDQAYAIDNGFTSSFPVTITYQNGIVDVHRRQGYIVNLYGRKYYLDDTNKAYKLANYNIQGSCADDLKEKIIKIDAFFEEHNCKSQILMPIHDELIYEIYDDERWVIPHLVELQRTTPKLMVPMVVEPDIIEHNWSEKKAYHF